MRRLSKFKKLKKHIRKRGTKRVTSRTITIELGSLNLSPEAKSYATILGAAGIGYGTGRLDQYMANKEFIRSTRQRKKQRSSMFKN